MRRRLFAALAALVLAGLGAVVLVSYVNGADARARAGEQLTAVLVVDERVPAGTSASALSGSLSEVQVPTRLAAPDAVLDLALLGSKVTTADLLPGEQVLGERFVDPETLLPPGVPLPAGSVQVSLTLEPQRAVGGALAPGDRVGVLVTTAAVDQATGGPGTVTSSAADDATVIRVTGGATTSAGSDSDGTIAAAASSESVTVTLVLAPEQAGAVIAGMEQDTVWLTLLSGTGTAGDPVPASTGTPTTGTTTTTGDDQ